VAGDMFDKLIPDPPATIAFSDETFVRKGSAVLLQTRYFHLIRPVLICNKFC
jgi:hypothetical protein